MLRAFKILWVSGLTGKTGIKSWIAGLKGLLYWQGLRTKVRNQHIITNHDLKFALV
jgi:hypothetical protein